MRPCEGIARLSPMNRSLFFKGRTATTVFNTLSLHDALPIYLDEIVARRRRSRNAIHSLDQARQLRVGDPRDDLRSEEHTSELQSQSNLVCRLLLVKKKLHIMHVHDKESTCAKHTGRLIYGFR